MDILAARKKAAELERRKKEAAGEPPKGPEEAPLARAEAPERALPPGEAATAPADATEARSGQGADREEEQQASGREASPEPVGAAAEREAHEPERPAAEMSPEEVAEAVVEESETLAFRLGREEYLVPIGQVKEVLKMRDATPVPHAPEYVPGVVSLRGNVLPVIDLAKRLGMAPGSRDDKSRIIVVGLDDEDAGLIVDRVRGVVRFLPDAVQPAPETLEQGTEFLKGIIRKEGKLYILLDLEKAVGV